MEANSERCQVCEHEFTANENKIMLLSDKSTVCQKCFDEFYGGFSKSPPVIDPDVYRKLLTK